MEKKLSTPWGPADFVKEIGLGILKVSTPSHGGYYVPPAVLATMPDALKCNRYAGGGSWFEEDCEWALVYLAFPSLFPFDDAFASAVRTIRGCKTYARAAAWIDEQEQKMYDAEAAAEWQAEHPHQDRNGFDTRAPFPHPADPHWSDPRADFHTYY